MKKIALASAAMGGVALIAFGASGTFASFQDVEEVKVSSGAASLDLVVGGGQVSTAPKATELQPGEATQLAYWVNNAGNTNGSLSATINVLADKENWCNEPEREAEVAAAAATSSAVTCDATGGEFDQYAEVDVLRAPDANQTAGTCGTATTGVAVPNVPQNAVLNTVDGATRTDLLTLPAKQGVCLVIDITLPGNAGNIVQGDSVDIGATLTLVQAPRV